MLRPAYLFSTAVLAAIASQLPDNMNTTISPTPPASAHQVAAQPLAVQAQTISSEITRPAQAKRWVF